MVKKITATFYEKVLLSTNQQKYRTEKKLKEKAINCMLNGNDIMIHSIVGLIKKISYKN